jgi:hypothetical protein
MYSLVKFYRLSGGCNRLLNGSFLLVLRRQHVSAKRPFQSVKISFSSRRYIEIYNNFVRLCCTTEHMIKNLVPSNKRCSVVCFVAVA